MMQPYSIRRRIEIDAAHRVPHHGSKCFNMHGHRYVIEAVCVGGVISDGEQRGMVMDFSFLKECMMVAIYAPCDHGTIFYMDDPVLRDLMVSMYPTWSVDDVKCIEAPALVTTPTGWKLCIIDRVPTAENLAAIWHTQVQREINAWFVGNAPQLTPPTLARIDVWETPNCVASYPTECVV